MVAIIWTERALVDLEDIAEYISKDSVRYAKVTIDNLVNETKRIHTNPFIGRMIPEVNQESFRELIKGNYRIMYKIEGDNIYILTVHHSAREIKRRTILPL